MTPASPKQLLKAQNLVKDWYPLHVHPILQQIWLPGPLLESLLQHHIIATMWFCLAGFREHLQQTSCQCHLWAQDTKALVCCCRRAALQSFWLMLYLAGKWMSFSSCQTLMKVTTSVTVLRYDMLSVSSSISSLSWFVHLWSDGETYMSIVWFYSAFLCDLLALVQTWFNCWSGSVWRIGDRRMDGLSEFASACLRYKARFVLIVSFACRERQWVLERLTGCQVSVYSRTNWLQMHCVKSHSCHIQKHQHCLRSCPSPAGPIVGLWKENRTKNQYYLQGFVMHLLSLTLISNDHHTSQNRERNFRVCEVDMILLF